MNEIGFLQADETRTTSTKTGDAPDSVRLEIPAAAPYLRLARLAASDIATRAGWGVDDIDDLRIAIDELCYAIGGGAGAGRLVLAYTCSGGRIEVQGTAIATVPIETPTEISVAIINATVDEFDLDAPGAAFRLVKRA